MTTNTMQFTVTGEQAIHCEGCEQRISRALERFEGVETVEASARTQHISVDTDLSRTGADQLRERLDLLGYEVSTDQTA